MSKTVRIIFVLILAALLAAIAWKLLGQAPGKVKKKSAAADLLVPVQAGDVGVRNMQLVRRFSGTLKPNAEFIVAPKIAGRIVAIHVDLADTVQRGMVVAEIDEAELQQNVAQAEAELLVMQANHSEAVKLQTIAKRELKRIEKLRSTGVSSEAQIDTASAEQLAKVALVNVTRAKITKAEAELATARIKLQEAKIHANWLAGSDSRLVAERFIDEGETVSANTPLLKIVELDPLIAVFNVTEADYASLHQGQSVRLSTDAYASEEFAGSIERIAPVFSEDTRQARVEIKVPNISQKLKPGMFVRADVVLAEAADAIVIPAGALYRRDDSQGVFLLNAAQDSVSWVGVKTGIEQDGYVQVTEPALQGRVVILGQQMLKPGSAVRIVK